MNVLAIRTEKANFDLAFALRRMGHDVQIMDEQFLIPLSTEHQPFCDEIRQTLLQQPADFVITCLYVPELSDLCNELHIPYLSWNYDSPLVSLFHPSIYNDCNRIFLFDRAQYERLQALEAPHIYHMPLATDGERALKLTLTPEDREVYRSEISFVGQLYEKNLYNICRGKLPAEYMLPINVYLQQQMGHWESPRHWTPLPEYIDTYLTEVQGFHISHFEEFVLPRELYLGLLMFSRKLAEMERVTGLLAANEVAPVDLYTESNTEQVQALRLHGPVNYETQLGKVYQCSRINLNFTLPSIETGVPQRVFDILSYGGFLLTNAQPELPDCFTPGKDLAVFHDLNELKELTAYYLAHEDERRSIAASGQQKVLQNYTYEQALTRALQLAKIEEKKP